MESSPQCKKYVDNKTNQSMEKYLTQNNTMMSTVWGSDVKIFCMAIWLKTDVFVYINNTWDKFSSLGTVDIGCFCLPGYFSPLHILVYPYTIHIRTVEIELFLPIGVFASYPKHLGGGDDFASTLNLIENELPLSSP